MPHSYYTLIHTAAGVAAEITQHQKNLEDKLQELKSLTTALEHNHQELSESLANLQEKSISGSSLSIVDKNRQLNTIIKSVKYLTGKLTKEEKHIQALQTRLDKLVTLPLHNLPEQKKFNLQIVEENQEKAITTLQAMSDLIKPLLAKVEPIDKKMTEYKHQLETLTIPIDIQKCIKSSSILEKNLTTLAKKSHGFELACASSPLIFSGFQAQLSSLQDVIQTLDKQLPPAQESSPLKLVVNS